MEKLIIVWEVYIVQFKILFRQNAIRYEIFAVNRILSGSNAQQISTDKPVNYYFEALVTKVTLE